MRKKKLASRNMGYGRAFYADEPEDLAYLKHLAKETRGDESKWPELNLRIYGRPKQTVKVTMTICNDISGISGTLTRLIPTERIKQIISDEVNNWRDLKVEDIKVEVPGRPQ